MFMRRVSKRDDRGIALISVMICVMLCFLLSATIMRISLLSYLQKGIGKQSTATFYENETFVDDIKLGVQQKVAEAFATTSTAVVMNQGTFVTNFLDALRADGYDASTADTDSDKDVIARALFGYIVNSDPRHKVVGLEVLGEGAECIFTDAATGEIVIKNVKIEYTDNTKGGYISNIKTDIRIRSPYYVSKEIPVGSGKSYTMIASNGGVLASGSGTNPNRNEWGNLQQNGSVYFGYKTDTVTKDASGIVSADSLEIKDYLYYIFEGEEVIINGNISISNHSCLIFLGKKLIIRGTITLDSTSHIIVAECASDASDEMKKKYGCANQTDDYQEEYGEASLTCKGIKINGTAVTSSTTFNAIPNAGGVKGLPVDYDFGSEGKRDQNSLRTSWSNCSSTIGIYTIHKKDKPTEGKCLNGTLRKANSLEDAGIKIDSTIKPKANVDVNGTTLSVADVDDSTKEQYDYELYQVLDVKVLNASSPDGQEPKFFATSYSKYSDDVEDPTRGLKSKGKYYSISNTNSHTGQRWNEKYYKADGTEVTCKKFGLNMADTSGNTETVNDGCGYFMVKWANSDLKFGQLNNGVLAYYGSFYTKKRVIVDKKGPLAVGHTFEEWVGSDHYTKILDFLGTAVFNGSSGKYANNCLNNWFVGGIKSIYSGKASSEETTTEYKVDSVKNRTLDVVTFENWEKY